MEGDLAVNIEEMVRNIAEQVRLLEERVDSPTYGPGIEDPEE